jgi:hypothetical protein
MRKRFLIARKPLGHNYKPLQKVHAAIAWLRRIKKEK